MKLDAITIGAIGFAGFAAWAYLSRNKGATTAGGAGQVYNMLGNQRADVGTATKQNTQQLAGLTSWNAWANNANRYGLSSGGTSWGLQA
jgi:hypothetical protein